MIRRALRRLLRGPPPAAPRGPSPEPAPPAPDDAPSIEVEAPVDGSLLVDIREPGEMAQGVAPGALLLPMDALPHHLAELPRDRPLTVYCAAGARSFGVAHWLREQGFPAAYSLDGGTASLRAAGIALAPPPGTAPGTRLALPAGVAVDGVALGVEEGEVVAQDGDALRVRVTDRQGFAIVVRVAVAEVTAPR